jgi:nucleoside-diphosphate-sugar epimerase
MRLLVLGGTAFVGRAVVTEAVDRGWSVTTFNRGRGDWAHPDVERIVGDRIVPADVRRLRSGDWDAVVDTWAGAPRVVRDSAAVLADHVGRYFLVSSRAVYAPPTPRGMDESAATVPGSADADATAYGRDKRGAELAVEACGLVCRPARETVADTWAWLLAREGLAPRHPDHLHSLDRELELRVIGG